VDIEDVFQVDETLSLLPIPRREKIGIFIEQFFQAVQAWSRKTGTSDEMIRQSILVDVGRYDEAEDIEYNLSMVEKRLEVLVEEIHLSEQFLITSLIRQVGHIFEDHLEDAAKGEQSRSVRRVRAVVQRLLERATEQERQAPAFQKRLRQLERFEHNIFPTPEKRAEIKVFLDTWREVTAPLLRLTDGDEA
jgi:hypothetical protein